MVLVWRLEKRCVCECAASRRKFASSSSSARGGACRRSKCYYNICRKRTTHGAGKLVAFTRGRVCSSLWYIYTEIYKYCTRGSGARDLFDYIYTHMHVEFTITRSILALHLSRPLSHPFCSPYPLALLSSTYPSSFSPPSHSGLLMLMTSSTHIRGLTRGKRPIHTYIFRYFGLQVRLP